jgi:hypothetical protein
MGEGNNEQETARKKIRSEKGTKSKKGRRIRK